MLFIRIFMRRMITIYKTRFREFMHIWRSGSSYRIKIRSPADP